ncbi:MAG: flippase [Chloroflexi bacterium]|nr:flippase [Chloroflexota bacterium]
MLARQSVLIFTTRIANMLLNMVALYLVARHVGPAALGVVAATTAFISLFGGFSDLGLTGAHGKRVSEGRDLAHCVGTYLLLKSILTVGAVLATVAVFVIRRSIGDDPGHPETVAVFTLLVVASLVSLASDVTAWTFIGRREVAKQVVPSFVGFTCTALAQVLVALFAPTATGLAAALLLGTAISAAFGVWLFRGYPIAWPRRSDIARYVTFAAPSALASITSSAGGHLDKVIIEHFRGPTEVAYYYAAERFVNFLLLGPSALAPILMPVLSLLHTQERSDDLRITTLRAERFLSLLAAPLCAAVVVLAEPAVLLVFGSKFAPAIDVLRVAGVLAYVYATIRPFQSLLLGIDRPDLFAKITVVSVPISALLGVVFVSRGWMGLPGLGLGAVGAAWAVLLTNVGVAVATRLLCWRLLGIGVQASVARHIAAGVAAGLVVGAFYQLWPTKPALAFVPFAALLGLLYLALLVALRELSWEDVRLMLDAASPLRMQRYLRRELRGAAQPEAR